jgi:pimeloyl-ACP methyl ester carboxylesterase
MSKPGITRHFATVTQGRWGDRQVHYRRAGSGPVIVLLHQSPLSSRDVIPAMERWSRDYTCIAPDTPGYGLSDPLGVERAEMQDFAEAVIEFFDVLGLKKPALYGFHTGAMIAVAVARYFPERVASVAANGYVLLTEPERADLVEHYLPPFVPAWDGSHLTWLWSRMREQTIFFPWYSKRGVDRLDFDVPSPEALQAGLLDFLRAGDAYRVGYRAAFTMQSAAALAAVEVPVLITAAAYDPLTLQLPRIRRKSASVTVEAGGSIEQTLDLALAFLARSPGSAPPPVTDTAPLLKRSWNAMLDVPGGQLRVRRNNEGSGRPVVVQHDAAGSSDVVRRLAESFIGRRPVIAIDLPGHGESDNTLEAGPVTVEGYAKVVLQALDALGIREFDFVGTWGGGLVGLELALAHPERLRRLVMTDLLYFPDALRAELLANYTPEITPNWYGGHLLHAWHLMRDQGLFWPWYARTRQGIIWKEPHVDPAMVHGRVIEMFKAPRMWRAAYQAHFSYPLQSRLAELNVPTLVGAPAWDPNLEHTRAAAADHPRLVFRQLADDWGRWGGELMDFLDA